MHVKAVQDAYAHYFAKHDATDGSGESQGHDQHGSLLRGNSNVLGIGNL